MFLALRQLALPRGRNRHLVNWGFPQPMRCLSPVIGVFHLLSKFHNVHILTEIGLPAIGVRAGNFAFLVWIVSKLQVFLHRPAARLHHVDRNELIRRVHD
jgi:hypothetical protein